MNPSKIAIIGCGPAGLSAAIALHDQGHAITLFEQFDEPTPVGSGLMLQPTGLEVLGRWGLRKRAESLGQRIDGMLGRVAPNGKVVLDIRYDAVSEDLYGVAIHRASLFDLLFQAVVERDIPIKTNARITSAISKSETTNDTVPLQLQLQDENGKLLDENFNLVVDASGARSALVQQSGMEFKSRPLDYGALWTTVHMNQDVFDASLLEQRYSAANVMVGVLPCGTLPDEQRQLATLFWSIRSDQVDAFRRDGLQTWKQQVIKQWPAAEVLLNEIKTTDQLTHAQYSHHTLPRPYRDGVVFIGDAAHATSPQLGQGANMALLDSLALASALQQHQSFNKFAALYARMRRNHVRLFQIASWNLTPFYQSDSKLLPALRDTTFEPVSKLPLARRLVTQLGAGLLTNPVRTIDRLSPNNKA